ncbi:MAG: transposase [Firmicutes bacterium]|nr:transposase [Bacillota bacterium]
MLKHIKRVYQQSRSLYGYPRVAAQLRKEGIQCGRNRVARLMREKGIQAKTKRKFRATTNSNHKFPIAPISLIKTFR